MILTRIKRGATRSLLLVKHKLHSTPRRSTQRTWKTVRNFFLNALVVRVIILPIPLVAPASAAAATTDSAEPPSIVRLSSTAVEALTFTPDSLNGLTVHTDSLQSVEVGQSEAAQAAEQARIQAEQEKAAAEERARQEAIAAEQRAEEARKAAQARALAQVAQYTGGGCNGLFDAIGMPDGDRGYAEFIINHEAGCGGTFTWNHAGSGAYGICQALPGSKMASAGSDWASNPVTQIRWCDGYAKGRYGGWAAAYRHWVAYHAW